MTQWMAITISTMYGYLLWMVTHYGWHNVRYYCWHNVWLLWIAQCMATYHGRLPTMYGTMYATIVGTMYGYPNVQLWLLCLRRINSSQYQVTSKCMTHFKIIENLFPAFCCYFNCLSGHFDAHVIGRWG